jgi:hypothetical protein
MFENRKRDFESRTPKMPRPGKARAGYQSLLAVVLPLDITLRCATPTYVHHPDGGSLDIATLSRSFDFKLISEVVFGIGHPILDHDLQSVFSGDQVPK